MHRRDASVQIRSAKGIPLDVRLAVRSLVAWLRATQDIPHHLIVAMVPEQSIMADDVACFGCFQWPTTGERAVGRYVWMHVAAGMVDLVCEQDGDPRSEGIDVLLHTILHEFVHYEQWRDGGESTERGVNRRASLLLRAFSRRGRDRR